LRPKTIPGHSISAESNVAAPKVVAMAAQNCGGPYPYLDPKKRIIGMWTR
jgi:hypothetical protein